MPKTVTSELAAHLQEETTTLATLWKVTRKDGTVFRFTDHDSDIVRGGERFRASVGYDSTAVTNSVGLSVDNLDVRGFLEDSSLTDPDLRAGKFDFADVRIELVNYEAPDDGAIALRRGTFGEVTITDTGEFQTELRGLAQQYSQRIGKVYSPSCRADLGDSACKVGIDPPLAPRGESLSASPESPRDQGGRVTYVLSGLAGLADGGLNTDFEFGDLTGWTTVSGNPAVITDGAKSGDSYLRGADEAGSGYVVEQVFDLSVEVNTTAVDNGDTVFDYESWSVNKDADANDSVSIKVDFLDLSDNLLSTAVDTGDFSPGSEWVSTSTKDAAVPAGTRKVRVTLTGTLDDSEEAGTCGGAHDIVTGAVRDLTVASDTWETRKDTIFKVVQGGVTSETRVKPDTTPGARTADGGVIVEAERAWKRFATVTSVSDDRTFRIDVAEDRAANDGWFALGAVFFETGNNAGTVYEIRDWTASTNEVTLFLPAAYSVQADDRLTIYPGCGKLLKEFCRDKFSNVRNFRGEPFVPGQDALLQTPKRN